MSVTHGQPIQIVARPIQPAPRRQAPVLTSEQRSEIAAARRLKQASVDEDIQGWYDDSVAFATTLATRFGRDSEHYLNMMFSGAAKLRAGPQRKANAYNAYLHHLASESNDHVRADELSRRHSEEYRELTDEQKQQYVAELQENRNSQQFGTRISERSRIHDVKQVCKTIEEAMLGLQARVGIQGFYCIVRSTTAYQLTPRIFFTNRSLDTFLRGAIRGFQPETIASLSEAFSIAGLDYMSFLRTTGEKVAFLKSEIRELINQALADATGVPEATMSYVQFTRDVQLKYKVTLEGWTPEELCKPADLPANVTLLQQLRDRLANGQCFFRRLGPSEYVAIEADYNEKVASGQVQTRKKRSDAGKARPRGQKHLFDNADERGSQAPDIGTGHPAAKRPRLDSGSAAVTAEQAA
ncbi:hypothetical protein PYCCODRAFT_1469127 [Trametes coccinea BRFM310]|uniref:Uncharacterized protein n=1 Tax=Trametes coccinea (strain BRFM310) TaxID=1353009 RepID=A0A1Y2IHR7_TRAC3|nr:hypothetical protein PYCCODRAFT_1469127 [Trametes coccinea BRFM310]